MIHAAFADHYGKDKSAQLMSLFINRAKPEAIKTISMAQLDQQSSSTILHPSQRRYDLAAARQRFAERGLELLETSYKDTLRDPYE